MSWLWNDFGFFDRSFDTGFDRTFAWMDDLRRRMDRAFGESYGPSLPSGATLGWATGWPRTGIVDTGNEVIVSAEVPGIAEKDLNISVQGEVVTISGKREVEVPEGYKVHREERGPFELTRSMSLPSRIDAERARAELKDGVLTLRLPKEEVSKPRQITVKATA